METLKNVDDGDLVDTDRETNNEESEEIYRIEERRKMIQNQTNQKLVKEIRENIQNDLK